MTHERFINNDYRANFGTRYIYITGDLMCVVPKPLGPESYTGIAKASYYASMYALFNTIKSACTRSEDLDVRVSERNHPELFEALLALIVEANTP